MAFIGKDPVWFFFLSFRCLFKGKKKLFPTNKSTIVFLTHAHFDIYVFYVSTVDGQNEISEANRERKKVLTNIY